MGGAQSIFTCAYDEAFQIPTEFSAEIALRTQQIVAYESGISKTVDPLGGSFYVEHLTNRMEEEILKVMGEIDTYGGVESAIEDGWLQMRLAERARERRKKVDSLETVIVGQNAFRRDNQTDDYGEIFRLDPTAAAKVTEKFNAIRSTRNNMAAQASLDRLAAAAANDRENLMPQLIDCCHAYATVGEMVARLKSQWGEFQEPVRL